MASAVARHPLRRDSGPQQLALTYRPPRLPAAVPRQSTPLLALPQELLVVIFSKLCASGAGVAPFTLASLQSLAFLARCCFHLYHDIRAFRPPWSNDSDTLTRSDQQWVRVEPTPGWAKKIPLYTSGKITGGLYMFYDAISDRAHQPCLEGMYGAPRLFFWPFTRFPDPIGHHRGPNYTPPLPQALMLELSLSDGLRFFNTSCKEATAPSAVKGDLWGVEMDDAYGEYMRADVFLHSPCKNRGNVHGWQLTLTTSTEEVYGEWSRVYELKDGDVALLRDFFNSRLPADVARCRYGGAAIEAMLPAREYGSRGGDVSPQNVLADGRRRASAQRADRSSHRVVEKLNALTGAGRIREDGALGEEFRSLQDAEQDMFENPDGYVDDQIARDSDDSDDGASSADGSEDHEYVDGEEEEEEGGEEEGEEESEEGESDDESEEESEGTY